MKTIVEGIERRLEKNEAFVPFTYLEDGESSERPLSLAEIRAGASFFAAHLVPGATTLILLPQGVSFIKTFFGCLYAGAIAVPVALPTRHRGAEKLRAIVDDARIESAVTNRATHANLEKWFGDFLASVDLKWIFVDDLATANHEPAAAAIPAMPDADQIAFLQYTSGSTARPKAVAVTHANIVANSRIIAEAFRNDRDSSSVCWLPSFHDMGLVDGIIQPVFGGFHCALLSPTHFLQKPARWLRALSRYRATYSGGPNFAFDFCADRVRDDELDGVDLSRLNCLYNGSEPVRPQTIERFVERFAPFGITRERIFTCYGLAEATLAVTTSELRRPPVVLAVDKESFLDGRIETIDDPAAAGAHRLVGCGRARGDTILKIVDPATRAELGDRQIGEVWVGGGSVTLGYRNDAQATANNYVIRDGNRFFRTGDLGFLSGGELFVTGRLKDLIIIRGKNHYPQDIEQTTAAASEALQKNSGAAFAVEVDGEERVVVVQEVRRTFAQKLDAAAVLSSILAALSREHGLVPHDAVLLAPSSLPKTSSGKIQRAAARRLWTENKLNALAAWRESKAGEENTAYENKTGNSLVAAGADRRRN